MKKVIPLLLGIVFIFSSIMTVTAFAASPASQDGLSATLTAAKSTYAANEDIELALTVTNHNSFAIDGIQTTIMLPEGVRVRTGSLNQQPFSLAADATKSSVAVVVKQGNATNSSSQPSQPGNSTGAAQSPQTGSDAGVAIWLTAMVVSAGTLGFLVFKSKRVKGRELLGLLLCTAVLVAEMLPLTANAAGVQRNFSVTAELAIDGRAVPVSAEIVYDYVVHNRVTVTDGTGSAAYAPGDRVTITANAPHTGYCFESWTVVAGGVTLADPAAETTSFLMPAVPVSVSARYRKLPSTVAADPEAYYQIPTGQAMILLGDMRADSLAVLSEGECYLPLDIIQDLIDRRFYWSAADEKLFFTTPTEEILTQAGDNDYYVNKSKSTMVLPNVKLINKAPYVSLAYLKTLTGLTAERYAAPERVVFPFIYDQTYQAADVLSATQLRTERSDQGDVLQQLAAGAQVTLLQKDAGENFLEVRTGNGLIGFVDRNALGQSKLIGAAFPAKRGTYTCITKDYFINLAYHQVTNQDGNNKLEDLLSQTKGVTAVCPSWISVSGTDGAVELLSSERYVEKAHNDGVEVWAQVKDDTVGTGINSVLSITESRVKLINNLIAESIKYSFDGIMICFGGVDTQGAASYLEFIRELSIKCRNNGIILCTNLTVCNEALSDVDRAEIANMTDYTILDAYVSPNTLTVPSSISSIQQAHAALNMAQELASTKKAIIGISFYSSCWTTSPTGGNPTIRLYSGSQTSAILIRQGITSVMDEALGQKYAEFTEGQVAYRIWVEDVDTLELKAKLITESECAGFACASLEAEPANVWNALIKYIN